jgi:5-hydroxyisourate hydrolase-like protein (transthyretin family)
VRRLVRCAAVALALTLASTGVAAADPPRYEVSCCAAWGYELLRGYVQPNGDWTFEQGPRGTTAIAGDYWVCDTVGDDSVVQAEILVASQRPDGTWTYRTTPLQTAGADAAAGSARCALYDLPPSVGAVDGDSAIGYVRVTVIAPGKATAQHRFTPPSPAPLPVPGDPDPGPEPDPPPGPPGPPPDREGACDPSVRASSLRLSASIRHPGRGSSVTTGADVRVHVSGRLVHQDGTPAAGARVCVAARVAARGAPTKPLATVVTDAAGRFSYVAPAGPSRRLWFVYRVGGAAAATHVDVRARATVTLRGSRRALRNGQTLVMSGRIGSGRRGVLVELQARRGARWQTFATTRAGRDGRYRYAYRFTRTTGVQRYSLRARVPGQPGYPFAAGAAQPIVVRVTG